MIAGKILIKNRTGKFGAEEKMGPMQARRWFIKGYQGLYLGWRRDGSRVRLWQGEMTSCEIGLGFLWGVAWRKKQFVERAQKSR